MKHLVNIFLLGFLFLSPFIVPSARAQKDIIYAALHDENNLGIVDPESGKLERRIQVGRNPDMVVLTADKAKLYVSNTGEVTVSIVTLADNAVTQVLRLPTNRRNIYAGPMTRMPDGSLIFVAERAENPNEELRVYVIDVKKELIVAQFDAGRGIAALSVSHDGKKIFVANRGEGVGVYDIETRQKLGNLELLKGAERDVAFVACSPTAPKAVVTYGPRNRAQVASTESYKTIADIPMPKYKTGSQSDIFISPDGKFAFLSNRKVDLKEVDGVNVLDLTKNEIVKIFNSGVCERGMTVTEDGLTFYVAADLLKWYKMLTLEHIRSISLRTKIHGIAVVRR